LEYQFQFQVYNQDGPRAQVDYRPLSNDRVLTKLCDHSMCQPAAEFEYAMIKLFLEKKINRAMWKEYRSQGRAIVHECGIPCYGEMILSEMHLHPV